MMIKIFINTKKENNTTINFVDDRNNFIGIEDIESNNMYILDLDKFGLLSKYYKNLMTYKEEIECESLLENNKINIKDLSKAEDMLDNSFLTSNKIKSISEGVCFIELSNCLLIFEGNTDDALYTGGATHKEMYSLYNEILVVYDKVNNKKLI